jgi:predicted HAD superfamily Cof-like phosphohydrolase
VTNFKDVGDFHHNFELPHVTCSYDGYVEPQCTSRGPREWDADLIRFRISFLLEELDEFIEGADVRDHAKMFDALIDLVYVAMGTAHALGYPWEEGWRRVQAANMAKVRAAADGSDSLRGSSWDVVKPPGWRPPDVAGLLKEHGFSVIRGPFFGDPRKPGGMDDG